MGGSAASVRWWLAARKPWRTNCSPGSKNGRRGFNLAYAVTHETFRDVVELLVPELQKRGVFKQEYREGTLREKLFGGGPRLAAPHPGASYRRDTAASVEEKVT